MVSTPATDSAKEPAWNKALLADPHSVADKRSRVQRMFAAIAPSYDLNNRLHSLWMDQSWRRKAARYALLKADDQVVDVACGTGDLSVTFAAGIGLLNAKAGQTPSRPQVVGVDFTFEMLPFAKSKAAAMDDDVREQDSRVPDRWTGVLKFINGDAQHLPLADQSADVVSIAFGIRNVADPATAFSEFCRVLRPGGRVIVLEFSLPANPVLRGLYNFYFRKILPRTATLISRDKTGAYKYLPESVNTFIGRPEMVALLQKAGFDNIEQFPMTFGVCVCYRGFKTKT